MTEAMTALLRVKPGPELDRLVAEKVMGLKLDWEHDKWSDDNLCKEAATLRIDLHQVNKGRGVYVSCECGLNGYLNEIELRRCTVPSCKPYSTDIAAAWEVAEKFFGAWRLSLERSFDHLVWNCEIETVTMSRSQIRQKVYARSDVAPLAICLAALRAKGVDVEVAE